MQNIAFHVFFKLTARAEVSGQRAVQPKARLI